LCQIYTFINFIHVDLVLNTAA